MDIQRLRNLTTLRMHTGKMEHIAEDMEYLTGLTGLRTGAGTMAQTDLLNIIRKAMEPFLRAKVRDSKFWEDAVDTTHVGEFDIQPMSAAEREEFQDRCRQIRGETVDQATPGSAEMTHILICYQVDTDRGWYYGHTYATVGLVTADSIDEAMQLQIAKIDNVGVKPLGEYILRSVTKLDG